MNVRRLPARNDVSNIPHMLRNLAAELEAGHEPMPRTVFLVAIIDGDTPPDLYQFGAAASRLEEAGALASVLSLTAQVRASE